MSNDYKLGWAVVIISGVLACLFIWLVLTGIDNNVVYTAEDVKSSQNGLNYVTEGF